jgi:hypothetical protein
VVDEAREVALAAQVDHRVALHLQHGDEQGEEGGSSYYWNIPSPTYPG